MKNYTPKGIKTIGFSKDVRENGLPVYVVSYVLEDGTDHLLEINEDANGGFGHHEERYVKGPVHASNRYENSAFGWFLSAHNSHFPIPMPVRHESGALWCFIEEGEE